MKDTRRKVSRNWDVCPICGRALVFTMDYSQSACVDPECRYNVEYPKEAYSFAKKIEEELCIGRSD